MSPLLPVTVESVLEAKRRIEGIVVRTPLLRFPDERYSGELYLKLENLQVSGSFKARGAGNALVKHRAMYSKSGVWTPSAGNMALGLAYHAGRLGVPCTVVVPDTAPEVKVSKAERLGASVLRLPQEEFWEVQRTHRYEGVAGICVHPFADPDMMAGNGTIGLEILEDLPDVRTIVVPYGGGGLSCGIAAALRSLAKDVRIVASETDTGAPLGPSLRKGYAVEVPYAASFISGIGSRKLFEEMWPLARNLIDAAVSVNLPETADAVRRLALSAKTVAEGAGATALAAALKEGGTGGKTVCVVSGGNIDAAVLSGILLGNIP